MIKLDPREASEADLISFLTKTKGSMTRISSMSYFVALSTFPLVLNYTHPPPRVMGKGLWRPALRDFDCRSLEMNQFRGWRGGGGGGGAEQMTMCSVYC